MAKLIKETPVLYGKEAERFSKRTEHNKTKKAPKDEYDRVMANYRKMKEKINRV